MSAPPLIRLDGLLPRVRRLRVRREVARDPGMDDGGSNSVADVPLMTPDRESRP